MSRYWGWAEKGEKIPEAIPAGHWRSFTLLGALTQSGLLATMTLERLHRYRRVPDFSGSGFMSQAAARSYRGYGQPQCPQSTGGAGEDRSRRRPPALLARLFARPQSHRKMLSQDQADLTNSESAHG